MDAYCQQLHFVLSLAHLVQSWIQKTKIKIINITNWTFVEDSNKHDKEDQLWQKYYEWDNMIEYVIPGDRQANKMNNTKQKNDERTQSDNDGTFNQPRPYHS